MSELKEIKITPQDEFILAQLQCTDMDEEHAGDMQNKIFSALEQIQHLPVVLDMSNVKYVPSVALGALVVLLRKFKQDDRRFILVDIQSNVRELLTICQLSRLFEIFDSVDDARTNICESP